MTAVTYTIGKTSAPESRDYSSISNFEADIGVGISADLVTATETWTVEIYEDTGTTITESACTIDPTTDATYDITIQAASGHAFYDNITTSDALIDNIVNGVHHTLSATYSTAISIGCDLDIQGIQYETTANGTIIIGHTTSSDGTASRCIFHSSHATSGITLSLNSSSPYDMDRCLVIQNSSSKSGIKIAYDTKTVSRCTVISTNSSSAIGVDYISGTITINQTAIFGFATATDATTGNYNASDDTSTPGANSVDSLTFADQFESTSNDFRLKAGADLLDVGTNSGLGTDIIGTSLPQNGTEDIGCWEYIAAAGGSENPHYYYSQNN